MSPHRQTKAAPSKSTANKAATRKKKKSSPKFATKKAQNGEKSDDPSYEGAPVVENGDGGDHLGSDNADPSSQNRKRLNKRALVKASSNVVKENSEDITTCFECARSFRSTKALHGHLRSHPLKGYRGVVPPPDIARRREELANPSSTTAPQQQISASKQAAAAPKRDPNRLIDPTTAAADAACTLMYLSTEYSKRSAGSSHESEIYESPTTQKNKKKKKKKKTEDDFRATENHKEETVDDDSENAEGYEGEDHSTDHQIDGDGDDNKQYVKESRLRPSSSMIKKKKRKTRKSAGSYPCGICGKVFSTHQALGGHMASHNKSRKTAEEAFTVDKANEAELNSDEKSTAEMALKGPESGVHKCKKCSQIFTSGQALGGHQRKHNPLGDHGRKESDVVVDQGQKESDVVVDQGQKESDVVVDHGRKESDVVVDHGRKESDVVVDHGRKESKAVVDHGRKESDGVVDHGRKECDHGRTESNVVVYQGRKESNVVIDHGRKESKAVLGIDLNKPIVRFQW